MKGSAGITHEAVISAGKADCSQASFFWIGNLQGRFNRGAIAGGNQRIVEAE